MEILNATKLAVAYTMGLDPAGREHLVVVAKGTFAIPQGGGVAPLAPTNAPFVFADVFTGAPGFTAMTYESEFAPFKARCDVLAIATAYAPNGEPAERVPVSLRVGAVQKGFDVVGPRYWSAGLLGIVPSSPQPFHAQKISYDTAFGGGEPSRKDPAIRRAYPHNPVGLGYFETSGEGEIFGRPVPTTEERHAPITSPRGQYRPMSFGPIGRNFQERTRYAGTYDARWLDETFPFLPSDFDDQYYQAAPLDQQMAYPRGGEAVHLLNLTPRPLPPFALPTLDVPVELTTRDRRRATNDAKLDTIVLDPDAGVMHLVWRTSFPLVRNMHEALAIVVGRMSPGYYRARAAGKTYYAGIGKIVNARRASP